MRVISPGVVEMICLNVDSTICGAKNRINYLSQHKTCVVNCGKCHKPIAEILVKGSGFVHRNTIRHYLPPTARGNCKCCGNKPYPGDKLSGGFCPDCWANMDGMGRPSRHYR